MKVYVLVCVNENCDIVSVSTHPSLESARFQLSKEYSLEKHDAEVAGYEEAYNDGLEAKTAQVSRGDYFYRWEIKESELTDCYAEAKLSENKQDVIEDAYFHAKAVLDNDDIQHLTEPVEDFDSFYLDEGSETLMVWNREKRNYTSIFNLSEDLAYRIARQILDNDFISE